MFFVHLLVDLFSFKIKNEKLENIIQYLSVNPQKVSGIPALNKKNYDKYIRLCSYAWNLYEMIKFV